ncbi:hypothetical protein Airi02_087380 [Actinoallomurus iriomotensis]|uniref:Uncharacterized protein n=1 Tax=Actinoallomurus iriomotensis TaxID=478107 RepID=A0A9W6SC07_9ACTN|nr:hypothetical protein Airi02_087380 [Actinoallomurus iriomotensis]
MLTPGTPAATTLPACCTNVDRDGGGADDATGTAAAGAMGSARHTSADPTTMAAAGLEILMLAKLVTCHHRHTGVSPLT